MYVHETVCFVQNLNLHYEKGWSTTSDCIQKRGNNGCVLADEQVSDSQ